MKIIRPYIREICDSLIIEFENWQQGEFELINKNKKFAMWTANGWTFYRIYGCGFKLNFFERMLIKRTLQKFYRLKFISV